MWSRDPGQGKILASEVMASNLHALHCDGDGVVINEYDLGSGLVTNAGVNIMSNDFSWANCTLKQANFHAIGTGATAAASTDVWLQTAQGTSNVSGTTNGYMTGTQSIIANATSTPWSPVYQTVATFTFTGAVAVTEWIVALNNWANITHAATATTSTSLSDTTNSPFSAANSPQGTVETGVTTPSNTSPTTQPMLQIVSASTTVLTGLDNSWGAGTKTWLALNNQGVATPSGTSNYVVFPTAWDHKVFSVINVVNGDTIQFTYQLSINSGG